MFCLFLLLLLQYSIFLAKICKAGRCVCVCVSVIQWMEGLKFKVKGKFVAILSLYSMYREHHTHHIHCGLNVFINGGKVNSNSCWGQCVGAPVIAKLQTAGEPYLTPERVVPMVQTSSERRRESEVLHFFLSSQ